MDWSIDIFETPEGTYSVALTRYVYRAGDDAGHDPLMETRILECFDSRLEAESYRSHIANPFVRQWRERFFETGEPLAPERSWVDRLMSELRQLTRHGGT